MFPAASVKKGYWFYNYITGKLVQAKQDADPDIVTLAIYRPVPITRELLLKFGFKETRQPGLLVYTKNGFTIYRRRDSEQFQLEHFGEPGKTVQYIHELQKVYHEEVPDNLQ